MTYSVYNAFGLTTIRQSMDLPFLRVRGPAEVQRARALRPKAVSVAVIFNAFLADMRSHSTTDEPHGCSLMLTDAKGKSVPCTFRCQSSSVLTKHKKDVHKYNPKTDKHEGTSSTGKLKPYEKYIAPPRCRELGATSSSDPATIDPQLLSYPVASSATMPPFPTFNPAYQGQLIYAQPGDYRRLPKQEPLDVGALSSSYIPPPPGPGAWTSPQMPYSAPSDPIFTHMGQQWTAYPGPPYNYSANHW